MENNIEENLEDIQKELEKDLENTTEDVKESKGFLTSKDKFLSRPEWHAAVLGFAPIATAFLLPTPMGEMFIIMQLLMLRVGFNKKMKGEKVEGHLGDVMDEIAYTFSFTLVAVAVFTYFGIGSLTSIDMGQLLVTMLGGA